jgi:hypothetical protein
LKSNDHAGVVSPVVTIPIGRRSVEASRPSSATPGAFSIDVLATLARARERGHAACLLPSPGMPAVTCDVVPLVDAGGVTAAWIAAWLEVASAARRVATWRRDTLASVWNELHRELRRQAGDPRVPPSVRERLRAGARHTLARSARRVDAGSRFPRQALRVPLRVLLPSEAERDVPTLAADMEGPIAAVEAGDGRRDRALMVAAETVARAGLRVIWLGGAPSSRSPNPGAVWLHDFGVLRQARLVVCQSAAWQHAAYLTDTPSLRVNAPEPFSAYPVRGNGVFTLRQAIDLDSGRVLAPADQLTPSYLRNLRNHGHRETPPEHVRDAVHEVLAAAVGERPESAAQRSFREAVVAAAPAAAAAMPPLEVWGADDGFIGDGRLARCQADRLP